MANMVLASGSFVPRMVVLSALLSNFIARNRSQRRGQWQHYCITSVGFINAGSS